MKVASTSRVSICSLQPEMDNYGNEWKNINSFATKSASLWESFNFYVKKQVQIPINLNQLRFCSTNFCKIKWPLGRATNTIHNNNWKGKQTAENVNISVCCYHYSISVLINQNFWEIFISILVSIVNWQ